MRRPSLGSPIAAPPASAAPPPARDPVRALVGRGTLYSLATALQLAVTVVVLPVVTRLLPVAGYGVVAVALLAQLALALIASVGLPETLARVFFGSEGGAERAASLVPLVAAIAVAVAALADVSGSVWSPAVLGLEYDAPVRLAVWSCVPFSVLLTAQALLRARDRAGAFLASAALGSAGTQAAGLAAVLAWERTPTAFMAGILGGTVVAAVVASAAVGVRVRPLRDRSFVVGTLRISTPVVLHSLSLYLIWAGNRAVLTHIDGTAAAARFQVAYLVGGLTILLVSAIYGAWSPIVLGAGDQRWTTLTQTSRVVYRVAATTASATAIAAPVALLVLAPATYEPRALASTSAIVALAAVPFAAYCSALHVVLWHGRTLALAAATSVAAAANIGVNIALIPPFGLRGAAAATAISYTLQASLVWSIARRLASVEWPYRSLLLAAAGTVAAVAAAGLAPTSAPWLVVRVVAAVALLGWLVRTALRLR